MSAIASTFVLDLSTPTVSQTNASLATLSVLLAVVPTRITVIHVLILQKCSRVEYARIVVIVATFRIHKKSANNAIPLVLLVLQCWILTVVHVTLDFILNGSDSLAKPVVKVALMEIQQLICVFFVIIRANHVLVLAQINAHNVLLAI